MIIGLSGVDLVIKKRKYRFLPTTHSLFSNRLENNKGHPSKRCPSFYFVNCASSVDPFNAVVDEVPPVITCATSSK